MPGTPEMPATPTTNTMPKPGARSGAMTGAKALPRYHRTSAPPPGLTLQERDLAILENIWHYRWLTTSQLQQLSSVEVRPECRFISRLPLTRRLKLLYHNRYVQRLPRPLAAGSLEPVYVLDSEGARELSERHGEVMARAPSQLPRSNALDHLLAINAFRIGLTVACHHSPNNRLVNWQAGDAIKFTVAMAEPGARARAVMLAPDGFFTLASEQKTGGQIERGVVAGPIVEGRRVEGCVVEGNVQETISGPQLFYFVEVDLATEPSKTIAHKCRAYYNYWSDGEFGKHFSLPRQVGFRVIFVAPTAKRAATIMNAIGSLKHGRTMFWVTTMDQITPDNIIKPGFQDAATGQLRGLLQGTPKVEVQ